MKLELSFFNLGEILMYPIKFESVFLEKIWGGSNFKDYKEEMPGSSIGESWEVSCHENGMSIVKNGELKGKTLKEIVKEFGVKLIGEKISQEKFPLLTKIVSAKEKLSVQVHPDDDYAAFAEGSSGKTEAWYILEADEDAELIIGTKMCTKEEFKSGIEKNNLEKYLNKVKVKKDELYFIKSGLVHAILGGTLILEIEQNSDITYRVFDYGRNRKLHIDKALDVIDFNLEPKKVMGLSVEYEDYSKTYLCLNKYFSIERYSIKKSLEESSDEERFYIYFVLSGTGKLEYEEGVLNIKKGESFLVPAYLGKYKIEGELSLLRTYVPDMSKIREEILFNCIC